jgi:hypothetical protein
LKKKIQLIAETILNEEQCGFLKGRSCVDAIFTLKQILQKRREYNLPTYLIFLDYNKAYDRVDRTKLWEILKIYKIPKNLINAIKSLYINTKLCVPMDKEIKKCTVLEVNKGLRQRCGLSPILFDLYMNKGLEISRTYRPKGIKPTKNTEINTILFADDQILPSANEDDQQRAVTTILNK